MADLEPILIEIETNLSGITIDRTSLVPFTTQGFMSMTGAIDSSLGPAVLHIVHTPVREQLLQKVPEKLQAISDFLAGDVVLPTARILAYGYLRSGGYFLLQTRMPGVPLGTQTIRDNDIVRIYETPDHTLVTQHTEALLAHLHIKGPCVRYGHMTVDENGDLTAPYTSWKEFITLGSACWLAELRKAKNRDADFDARVQETETHSLRLQETNKDILEWNTPCFVHGDMINPGNILTDNNRVTALLDFEWAVSGDPAWEFAFTSEFPSKAYYEAAGEDPASFERRKNVYSFFWLLWGANVHVHNKDPFLCNWLLEKCAESARSLTIAHV